MPEFDARSHPRTGTGGLPAGTAQLWRWLAYGLGALILALVFALYLQPDMMVTLTEQLWACF